MKRIKELLRKSLITFLNVFCGLYILGTLGMQDLLIEVSVARYIVTILFAIYYVIEFLCLYNFEKKNGGFENE